MSGRDNRLLRVQIRKQALSELDKFSQEQHGIFQHFQTGVTDYKTREGLLSMRYSDKEFGRETEHLYGIGPEHEQSYVPTEHVSGHLSTRYSPDRPGVQAARVSDGVFQDPYTRKVYDYNEGFTTEDGRNFPGGSAAFQTDLVFASKNRDGLRKISSDESEEDERQKLIENLMTRVEAGDLGEDDSLMSLLASMQKKIQSLERQLVSAYNSPSAASSSEYMMHDEWIDHTGRGPRQDPIGWTAPGEDPQFRPPVPKDAVHFEGDINGHSVFASGKGNFVGPHAEFDGVTFIDYVIDGVVIIRGGKFTRSPEADEIQKSEWYNTGRDSVNDKVHNELEELLYAQMRKGASRKTQMKKIAADPNYDYTVKRVKAIERRMKAIEGK